MQTVDEGVCHTCSSRTAATCASRTCSAFFFDTFCLLTSAGCSGCPRLSLEPRRLSLLAVLWSWGVQDVLSRQWDCVRLGNVHLHLSIPLESPLASERCLVSLWTRSCCPVQPELRLLAPRGQATPKSSPPLKLLRTSESRCSSWTTECEACVPWHLGLQVARWHATLYDVPRQFLRLRWSCHQQ